MSRYNDNRRASSRRDSDAYPDTGAGNRRSSRGGRSASLSDLHQVSPQMRERYGVSPNQSSRRVDRYSDEWDYYKEPRQSRRSREAGDWRNPSVDPIGGRNIKGGAGRGSGRGGATGSGPGLPVIIGLAIALILVVVIIVLVVSRCSESSADTDIQNQSVQTEEPATASEASGSTSSSGSSNASASASSSGSASSPSSDNGIDRAKLTAILEDDIADKLINRAATSEDAKWIAQNPDKYAIDGDTVQHKLLKLAADEPAAQSYVRNFPDKYPMKTPATGKVNTITTGKSIPRLYQWDELWGYTTYSSTAFGLTGCCPTCLAMVYQGLTGSTDLGPYDMAEFAVRDGYADEYEGTYANFLVDEAAMLGLQVEEIDITEKALKNAIESGQVVIANFGPGIFTEYGHYVVITGRRQDGTLIMNDPYSEERSNKSWDVSTIVEESQGLYAYG